LDLGIKYGRITKISSGGSMSEEMKVRKVFVLVETSKDNNNNNRPGSVGYCFI